MDQLVAVQSAVIAESLWNFADEQIKLILAALAIDSDVESAVVYNEQGMLVGVTGSADAIERRAFYASKEIVYKSANTAEVIGRLAISLTDARLRLATRERMFLAGGLAAILLIAVVVSALIGHRRTIGIPLERLLASIERAREGGERGPVDWWSRNEIGTVIAAFNEMQVRQKAYERELEQARDNLEQQVEVRTRELANKEAQLRVAMENMPSGMFMIDAEQKFVLVNKQYQQLFNFPDGLLVEGAPLINMMRFQAERGDYGPGEIDELIADLAAHLTSGTTTQYVRELANGRALEIRLAPTPEGGAVAVATDITERRQTESVAREKMEEMEKFTGVAVGRELRMIALKEQINRLSTCEHQPDE